MTLDGVDLLVQANVDGTPGTVTVLRAPDDAAAQRALSDERKAFGEAHRDMRVQTQQFKDGLVRITDMCGNFATYPPSATPSAAPSPSQR